MVYPASSTRMERKEVQEFSLPGQQNFQATQKNFSDSAPKDARPEVYLAETRSSCTVTLSGPPRSSAILTSFMQASESGRIRAA